MWKAGAAISALIASAAAGVSNIRSDPNASLREQVDRLSDRIGGSKDANAIRRIHWMYEVPSQAGFIREQRSSRLAVIAAANGCDSSD
jgi:hypothetical protein